MNCKGPNKPVWAGDGEILRAAVPIRSILKRPSSEHLGSQASSCSNGRYLTTGRRYPMSSKSKQKYGRAISLNADVATHRTNGAENGIDSGINDRTEYGNGTGAEGVCWNVDGVKGNSLSIPPSLEDRLSLHKERLVETKSSSSGLNSVKMRVTHMLTRPKKSQVPAARARPSEARSATLGVRRKWQTEPLTASCNVSPGATETNMEEPGSLSSKLHSATLGARKDALEMFSNINQKWASSRLPHFGRRRRGRRGAGDEEAEVFANVIGRCELYGNTCKYTLGVRWCHLTLTFGLLLL